MADNACEVCGLNEFTAEAGFFYCVECGTKSQRGQEMVIEFHEGADQATRSKIKMPKPKKKMKRITSWEQANYILLGYTDLLVTLGAGEGFKQTVLQLWTAYLRRMEIAFFDKEAPELPRLPAFYKKADAEIIYNRPRTPSVHSAGASSSSSRRSRSRSRLSQASATSSRAVARQLRREQRDLLTAEHDSFLESQRSDVNRSLHDLSIRSINASKSGGETEDEGSVKGKRMRYSREARRHLKRTIGVSKEHIDKHERDVNGEMTCHMAYRLVLPGGKRAKLLQNTSTPQVLTRSLLMAVLGVALNVERSAMQMADLVRYNREEHIPQVNLMQYLPEELDPDCYVENIARLQYGGAQSHAELGDNAANVAKFLHVEILTPDMHGLCKRYLEELCLPADLMIYVGRLLTAFPPKMKFNDAGKYPNFEGRAMAMIIFVLKLLFGLNDSTEKSISKSAAKLNRQLTALGNYKPVFVFTEWARYIEMRKMILSQVNHTINRQVAKESGINADPALFIDSNLRKKRNVDSFMVGKRSGASNHVVNLKQVVTHVVDTQQRQMPTDHDRRPRQSIDFEASLTPFKSYLETFLLGYAKASPVYVPDFMHVDHSDRTVIPFIDPSNMREQLLKHHQIRFITKRAKSARDNFLFQDVPTNRDPLAYKRPNITKVVIIPEPKKSTLQPQSSTSLKTHEEILAQIIIENGIEQEKSRLLAPKHPHPIPDESSFISESLFSSQTSDTSPTSTTTSKTSSLTLLCPNFELWIRETFHADFSQHAFEEQTAHMLPESFRMVLAEGARVVENYTQHLYAEVLKVENYFGYAVEPVERWFFGGAEEKVQVKLRDIRGQGFRMTKYFEGFVKSY